MSLTLLTAPDMVEAFMQGWEMPTRRAGGGGSGKPLTVGQGCHSCGVSIGVKAEGPQDLSTGAGMTPKLAFLPGQPGHWSASLLAYEGLCAVSGPHLTSPFVLPLALLPAI